MSEPSSTVTKLTIEGLQVAEPQSAKLYDDESLVAHNHLTRDIKDEGQCPGCDRHHRMARRVAEAKSAKPTVMSELRTDEEIDRDLARKRELRAAFLHRLELVKAGVRKSLIDYSTAPEEDQINIRLANDVEPLREKIKELREELAAALAEADRLYLLLDESVSSPCPNCYET